MNVNDNTLDLAQFRGPVIRCPLCSNLPPAAKLEAATTGRTCRMCLGQQFISKCKNCEGTGQYKGSTIWDGGKSPHTSVCTPCGGSGVFAVRKPDNWQEPDMKAGAEANPEANPDMTETVVA